MCLVLSESCSFGSGDLIISVIKCIMAARVLGVITDCTLKNRFIIKMLTVVSNGHQYCLFPSVIFHTLNSSMIFNCLVVEDLVNG